MGFPLPQPYQLPLASLHKASPSLAVGGLEQGSPRTAIVCWSHINLPLLGKYLSVYLFQVNTVNQRKKKSRKILYIYKLYISKIKYIQWIHTCEVTSAVSNSLWPFERLPARLLCPWDSPGKNTGVGCHALLQEIFPTPGSNLRLLYPCTGRWVLYHQCHLGSPRT